MGDVTASKLRERMAQWQEYVETGFADEDPIAAASEQPELEVQAAVYERAPFVEIEPVSEAASVHCSRANVETRIPEPLQSNLENGNRATIDYIDPGMPRSNGAQYQQVVVMDTIVHQQMRPGSMHSFRMRNVPGAEKKRRGIRTLELRPERKADIFLAIWVCLTLTVIVAGVVFGMQIVR
jgi:hypothetical protein